MRMSFFDFECFAICAACSAVRCMYSLAWDSSFLEKEDSQTRRFEFAAIFIALSFSLVSRMNVIFLAGSL